MKYNELRYALKWKAAMLKTKLYYKRIFGHIGNRTTVCKPLLLSNPDRVFLGNHVRIREMARIDAICEYNKKIFNPTIIIDDDTGFEQGLHMSCGESIKIGKDVTVSAYVMIQDVAHGYEDINTNVLDQELKTDPVEIGDGCFIGLGARIMPGTHLGKHCTVGSNSVVMGGCYDDYSILVGNPAHCVKRYDTITEKWRKTDKDGQFCD